MDDQQNKHMEQFRNRETGNLSLYKDRYGKLFYKLEDIDDDTAMFISAETAEGEPIEKAIKVLALMSHLQDIPYDQTANQTKTNSEQTATRAKKPSKNKWHGWGWAVIILLIFFAIIYWTVQDSNNKKKQQTSKDAENIKQPHNDQNDFIWKDYNRVIGLLSVKYSFSDSIVKIMILEYLRINEPTKYSYLTMYDEYHDTTTYNNILKPKESIAVTINSLNRLYGIRKDTISFLLLDFEMWLQAKEK